VNNSLTLKIEEGKNINNLLNSMQSFRSKEEFNSFVFVDWEEKLKEYNSNTHE